MSQTEESRTVTDPSDQIREEMLAELEKIPHAPSTTLVALPAKVRKGEKPSYPPTSPHLPVLTSLRFFAAVAVVFGHCLGRFGLPATVWQLAQSVSFFFVLSGFTLTYAYPQLPRSRVLGFYRARAARIWPVYLLAIAAVIIFLPGRLGLEPDTGAVVKRVVGDALLVQFWVFDEFRCLIGATWTLSTLAALYLMFPLLIHKWEKTWHVKLLGSLLVLGFVWYACRELSWRTKFYEFGPYRISSPVYLHFLSRQFEFVLGMVMALAWRKVSTRWKPSFVVATVLEVLAIVLMLGAVPACVPLIYWALKTPWAGAPVVTWFGMGGVTSFGFAAIIFVFAMQRGALSSVLSRSIPVQLGRISFSMYVTHQIFLMYYVARMRAFPDWPDGLLLALYWMIVLVNAHFLWAAVEQPLRKLLRGPRYAAVATDPSPPASQPQRRWFARTGIRLAGEGALLLALILGMVGMGHAQPNIEVANDKDASDVKSILDRSRLEARDVTFGQKFELLGVASRKWPMGLEVQLVWKSLKRQPLDYNVRLIMLAKADGEILGRQAYRQDINNAVVDEGTVWVESHTIPYARVRNATMMGIILNKEDDSLLPNRGLRDNSKRRLIVPLE